MFQTTTELTFYANINKPDGHCRVEIKRSKHGRGGKIEIYKRTKNDDERARIGITIYNSAKIKRYTDALIEKLRTKLGVVIEDVGEAVSVKYSVDMGIKLDLEDIKVAMEMDGYRYMHVRRKLCMSKDAKYIMTIRSHRMTQWISSDGTVSVGVSGDDIPEEEANELKDYVLDYYLRKHHNEIEFM